MSTEEYFDELPSNHGNNGYFARCYAYWREWQALVLDGWLLWDLQAWARNPESGRLNYLDQVNEGEDGFINRAFSQFNNQRFSADQRFYMARE